MDTADSTRLGRDADEPASYQRPQLTELGRVSALTLGNSGTKGDAGTKKK